MEHERKMERRHQKRQAVLGLKHEAPQIRQRDAEYQEQVLRHWAQVMVQDLPITDREKGTIKEEDWIIDTWQSIDFLRVSILQLNIPGLQVLNSSLCLQSN